MTKNYELQHLDDVLYQVSSIGMTLTDPWMPASCKDISERLGISPGAVSRCIQKLAADKLVVRKPGHDDGFVITKEGEASNAHKRACEDEAALRTECFGGNEESWLRQIQARHNPY